MWSVCALPDLLGLVDYYNDGDVRVVEDFLGSAVVQESLNNTMLLNSRLRTKHSRVSAQ